MARQRADIDAAGGLAGPVRSDAAKNNHQRRNRPLHHNPQAIRPDQCCAAYHGPPDTTTGATTGATNAPPTPESVIIANPVLSLPVIRVTELRTVSHYLTYA